jgi:CRP-like cAMP-binding protein
MSGAPVRSAGIESGLGGSTLDALARAFPAGEVLFIEGDPGDRMFVIRSGKVKIFKFVANSEVTLALLGPGDFFGEMALLEKLPRTATALVVEDAQLIEVSEETFESILQRSTELAVRLLRKLSARLRLADERIEALLAKDGAARMLDALRLLAPPPSEADGRRALPHPLVIDELAVRTGLRLEDCERILRHLQLAGVLQRDASTSSLAPEAVLRDYFLYLELKQVYDPTTAEELAQISGLSTDELHRVVRRFLLAKLRDERARPVEERPSDSYLTYLELKCRFEYPEEKLSDHPTLASEPGGVE